MCSKFLDISPGIDFFGFNTKSKGNDSKNKHVGLHQTKQLLQGKKKKKRQPTEWEKIFPNHISDEELIPKIHKEGKSNPLQYSCLENPMDRGAWWATIHGVAKESDTT